MSRAADPQLHTHVVAGNLVRTPSDGKWRTLHAAVVYRHARTAGILYQSHLRDEVRDRLGLEWASVVKGAAELDAIPKPVLREFSTRRRMIEEAAAEDMTVGLDTKARAESAALKTRHRKDQTVRTADWRLSLRARAQEHGLDQAAIDQFLADGRDRIHPPKPTVGQPDTIQGSDEQPVATGAAEDDLHEHLTGPLGLTATTNTFSLRDALTAIAERHPQGLRVAQVRREAAQLVQRSDVLDVQPVPCAGVEEPHYTTTDLVTCEERLITSAAARRQTEVAIVPPATIDRALRAADRPLTAEQEHVVRTIATSGNGVDVVEALAGTGKTFTAGVLSAIYDRAGTPVIGVAPTGRAARELSEVGIPARTLHSLLASLDRHPDYGLSAGAVVILDEAGMAPTRLTARLLEAAQASDTKVIAIGDSGQLPSVQAGGWMRRVGQHVGALELLGVQRQRDPEERRMLGLLHDATRQDTTGHYLQWLDRCGRLDIDPDARALIDRAVSDWSTAVEQHGITQVMLVARDQQTRSTLNDHARADYAQRGALGDDRAFGPIVLAVGDRVIARRNDYEIDVDNGTRGTVAALTDHAIELRTDAGTLRTLPAAYVAEHVEHAYALTGHGMQGATVEWAGVVALAEHLTRGWAYTALSRAREATHLYVPQVDHERRAERADIAPHDDIDTPQRADTLDRISRRMLVRDDEDLAVTQLLDRAATPTGPDDRQITADVDTTPPQEQAAQRSEPTVPSDDRDQLIQLTAQLRDLERQRNPKLLRQIQRLDDLSAERQRISDQRDQAVARLDALPDVPNRRLRRTTDEYAAQRATLTSAITAADHRLAQIDHEEHDQRAALGVDPDAVRTEHRERESAIGRLDRQRIELRDRLVDHITPEPAGADQRAAMRRQLDAAPDSVIDSRGGLTDAARNAISRETVDSAAERGL